VTPAEKRALKARIAAMPKCPKCGGFALPTTNISTSGEFICKDHGRFVPKGKKA